MKDNQKSTSYIMYRLTDWEDSAGNIKAIFSLLLLTV